MLQLSLLQNGVELSQSPDSSVVLYLCVIVSDEGDSPQKLSLQKVPEPLTHRLWWEIPQLLWLLGDKFLVSLALSQRVPSIIQLMLPTWVICPHGLHAAHMCACRKLSSSPLLIYPYRESPTYTRISILAPTYTLLSQLSVAHGCGNPCAVSRELILWLEVMHSVVYREKGSMGESRVYFNNRFLCDGTWVPKGSCQRRALLYPWFLFYEMRSTLNVSFTTKVSNQLVASVLVPHSITQEILWPVWGSQRHFVSPDTDISAGLWLSGWS